jgi:hypothetical protein
MSADAGALATVEAPELDLTVPETPDTTAQEPTTEAPKVEDKQTEAKADARRNPDAIRKTLKWLSEQNGGEFKSQASALNHELGKSRAYSQVYPTVEEARSSKALFESVGGVEGIQNLQSSRAKVEQIDSQLAAGDPAVLDALFADDTKEGMTKLVAPILERIAQQNPQAYEQAITPHALGFMEKAGLVGSLNALVAAFRKGDAETQKDVLTDIVNWYNGLRQNSQTVQAKTPDPAREKFDAERKEFDKKQHDAQVGEVFNGNLNYASSKIDEHLKPYMAKLNLKGEALELLRQDVWKKFEKTRNASPEFKTFTSANYKQGKGFKDAAQAKTYLNNLVDMRMKEAVDGMVNTRYGAYLKTAAKPSPTQPIKPQAAVPNPQGQAPRNSFERTLATKLAEIRGRAR